MTSTRWLVAGLVAGGTLLAGSADAAYEAEQVGKVVRLTDREADTVVSLVPSLGNMAIEMRVKGHNVLRFPFESLEEARGPFFGVPFLAPWANRLDETGFYANGQRYAFDMDLGNVRGERPIHGLLTRAAGWEVVELAADASSAWVTSRLEFFRFPSWMKQFPFAHTIEMTHRLKDGVLEVHTRLANLSVEPMPVSIGFHPYFQLTDSKRDEWTISVGARRQWVLDQDKIPTGETVPIEDVFPDPAAVALRDLSLDDVFGDLVRDDSGRAVMSVKGRSQEVEVVFGPLYRVVVIFAPRPGPRPDGDRAPAPPGRDLNFVCFEPMAGITNAMNAAHKGLYPELQSVPPGGQWEESFWVRPRGF
jgi:aldose 1-epimerase